MATMIWSGWDTAPPAGELRQAVDVYVSDFGTFNVTNDLWRTLDWFEEDAAKDRPCSWED